MFVQSIEGSWLHHPFWKSKFLLTDEVDLEALLTSGIKSVMIDPAKGLVPAVAAAAFPEEAPPLENERATRRTRAPKALPATCSASDEMQRAAKILHSSKRVVKQMFADVQRGRKVDAAAILPIVGEVASSVGRNPHALITVAQLKTIDEYTFLHSVAVGALMINFATQLGFAQKEVLEAGLAGMLHDIGKIAMPLDILNKPGRLTPQEYEVMRAHPERGHELLTRGFTVPEAVLDVCLHHHERIDGSGYPHGLAGDQISRLARMTALCDVYDALTSRRPYKPAEGAADTLSTMYQWEGHFDVELLAAFIRSLGIYPVGTLVRLASDRLALVTDQNMQDLTRPSVRAFFSIRDRRMIAPFDVDLAQDGDKIARREKPESWGLTPWDEHWPRLLAG